MSAVSSSQSQFLQLPAKRRNLREFSQNQQLMLQDLKTQQNLLAEMYFSQKNICSNPLKVSSIYQSFVTAKEKQILLNSAWPYALRTERYVV